MGAGLQVRMQRIEHVMTAPGVGAFLDAVDARLNSNTFLLAHRVDHTDVARGLAALLHAPAFEESLRWADHQRGWDNYLRPGTDGPAPVPGRVLRDDARLRITHIDEAAVLQRLEWMVNVGGDWYGTAPRREPAEAQAEARAFLAGLDAAAATGAPWAWCQASPDFLHSHGYFDYVGESPTDEDANALAYFDGGGCDGALAALSGDVLVLLLTNGSP
jgi:hypothetical protein